jgi:hypothetical protein
VLHFAANLHLFLIHALPKNAAYCIARTLFLHKLQKKTKSDIFFEKFFFYLQMVKTHAGEHKKSPAKM